MIIDFLIKHSPPGMSLKQEKRFFISGIICSALYSLLYFFDKYATAYDRLYIYYGGKRILRESAVMPNFRSLLGYTFIGFLIVALVMFGFIIYHYAYYRQGSMSIYLMKRLPKRAEIHKRALTLPLIALFLCILTVFILLMIYFAIYMLATPKECLMPDQWQILWRITL